MAEYKIKSLEEQLASVQDAIEKIEMGAQEYQIGNRRLTRADLKTLYSREAALRSAIAAQNGAGDTKTAGILQRDWDAEKSGCHNTA